jgi:hypothetical protein
MNMRSIRGAAGVSMLAAILALAATLPTPPALAQGQIQAVPRAGVAFSNAVTVRAKVESIDSETRTIAFTTNDGKLINVAVADGVRNLDGIEDGATVDVTYNEVVTILNLRQKGPGSREARREGANPTATEVESGRFTLTVVSVDLANNRVSLIDPRGGPVRSLAATSIAKKEALKTIKVGDVVIGLTTPLLVTAIAPAR